MRALNRKLWRDIWRLRSQLLAIGLVIASGVAVYVLSYTAYGSLVYSRDSYYQQYAFADVFASIKRAPQSLMTRIAEIPGVAIAEGRVAAGIRLEISGFDEPVDGLAVSVPDVGLANINRLYVGSGRLPRGNREVMLSEAFAEAHSLKVGDDLIAIINGRREQLIVVGLGLSPEHIFQMAPGAALPDFKRFGVLWMARKPLAQAYDMEGAFNDVALLLSPGASESQVVSQLDTMLSRYGGRGAYGRADQLSNRFLREEFRQLESMAVMFPLVFLTVAVFLLNIVLQRLIATQRENIAALKAFGYSNREVAWHYLCWVFVVSGLALVAGMGLGLWLGKLTAAMYDKFYRFPELMVKVEPGEMLPIVVITLLASVLACLQAVRGAANMPPAQAMHAPLPANYKATVFERMGWARWLSPPMRMVWRHLERRPIRTLFSVLGISAATSILMVGNFQADAIRYMLYVQFNVAQNEDLSVTMTEPVARGALYSMEREPGVAFVEPVRTVPVRLHFGAATYRTGIQGIEPERRLLRLVDPDMNELPLPAEGILLSEQLAEILRVQVGDTLQVESLEGKRKQFEIPVGAVSRQFLGVSATMSRRALNHALGEGDVINMAMLKIHEGKELEVFKTLREMPRVASVSVARAQLRSFEETLDRSVATFTFINMILGAVIAFGVIYNLARIALAERARELASLQVLGYSRGEVSYILLAELALFTLAGIVPGLWLGNILCHLMSQGMKSELMLIPVVLENATYALSAGLVVLASIAAGIIVWFRIGRLDLVAVLKTRE